MSMDPGGPLTAEDTKWAMAAHLLGLISVAGYWGFLGPLVIWLVRKGNSPFVDEHAVESLNFQITVLLVAIVGGAILAVLGLLTCGMGFFLFFPAGILLVFVIVVFCIQGGLAASRGESYEYPICIRLVSNG